MKSIKKWVSTTSSIIIYGLLICMIITVISSKINGGAPKVFGYEIMSVLSGSMEPGIKTGSIIAVKPVDDPTKLKKGDVITFKAADNANTLITHRIIEVQKVDSTVQYVTKGDNNKAKDPSPVTTDRVVAEYNGFTIPSIGNLMAFVKSKLGAIYLMIVPGALMVLWSVFSIWRAISKFDSQKQDVAG